MISSDSRASKSQKHYKRSTFWGFWSVLGSKSRQISGPLKM